MRDTHARKTFLTAGCLFMLTLTTQAAPLVFEGHLVPPGGQSVNDYTVCVEHHEGQRQTPPSEFRVVQQPDADGAFRIEIPSKSDQYWLFIQDQAGHVLIGYSHLDESRDFGTIALRNDGELTGVLYTPGSNPAPDVRVLLERKLDARCSHYVVAGNVHSDAQGGFAFARIHPGDYRVRIESDLYTHAATEVAVTEDINYLEFLLEPAVSIRGRVTLSDGSPAEGVTVFSRGRAAPATTDAEGRYHLGGLEAGDYRLQAKGDGLVTKDFASLSVTLGGEDVTAPDIVVLPVGSLRVTLTPSAPGKPLPEQLAIALDAQGERYSRFPFDAAVQDGVVVFEDLAPGDFVLRLRDETLGDVQTNVTITSGTVTALALVLPEVFEITGTITEADGTPVQGARVYARAMPTTAAPRMHMSRHSETDANGVFRVGGLVDGTYNITFYDSERHEELSSLSDVPAGSDELMVILAPIQTIPLRVVAPDGSPVTNAAVTVVPSDRGHMMYASSDTDSTTDSEGRTTITVRGGSRYTIGVRAAAWVDASQTLDLSEGREAPVSIEIVMQAGVTVAGTVVDSGGAPRPGVHITSAGCDAIQADAQGAFAMPGVGPGLLVLQIHADTDQQIPLGVHRMLIEASAKSVPLVRIVLPVPGSIRGTFRDGEGNPVPNATVMLNNMADGYSGQMSPSQVQSDNAGAFIFDTVIPGNYMLMAMPVDGGGGMGSMPAMRMIDIQAGQTVVADLPETQAAGETVSGRITHNSKPLSQVRVMFIPLDADGKMNAMTGMSLMSRNPTLTDTEGRYTASNLIPGNHLVLVATDGEANPLSLSGAQHAVPVSVAAGQSALDISLVVASLRGIVKGSDGEPVAGVKVTVSPTAVDIMMQEMMSRTAETGPDGRFEIADLATGRFRIAATDDARVEAVTLILELDRDAPREVVIQLAPGLRIEGRVQREPEGSVDDAFVMAFSADGCLQGFAGIEEDGRFSFENVLSKGRYFVACLHPELVAPGQLMEAGESTPLAFVLRPGGDVAVTLTGDRARISGRTLLVTDAAGNTVQRLATPFDMGYMARITRSLSLLPTDENGRTSVYGLPAGTYTLRLADSDASATVTVRPFEKTAVELALE